MVPFREFCLAKGAGRSAVNIGDDITNADVRHRRRCIGQNIHYTEAGAVGLSSLESGLPHYCLRSECGGTF